MMKSVSFSPETIVSARLPSSFVQPFGAGDILMPALVFVALCSLPVTTSRATAVVVMNGDEELVTVARRRAHLEDFGSALLGGNVIPVGNAALGFGHDRIPGVVIDLHGQFPSRGGGNGLRAGTAGSNRRMRALASTSRVAVQSFFLSLKTSSTCWSAVSQCLSSSAITPPPRGRRRPQRVYHSLSNPLFSLGPDFGLQCG